MMAALNFPNSPTVNQQYSAPSGALYTYDGAAWTLGGPIVATPVGPAGGDLTGTYPNPTISGAFPLSITVSARISRSTAQSIPNTTQTVITFDTAITNQGGMWNAGAPDRLTVQRQGFYLFGACVQFNATGFASARRFVNLLINGASYGGDERGSSGGYPGATPVIGVALNPADYCQVQVYQDSGGALNVQAMPLYLWAARIA